MTQIILVRHGQANTGARDEESYDKLSDLGRQQARWLGEYLHGTDHGVTRIISGNLFRQRDTAAEIADKLGFEVTEDPRLKELDYFSLAKSLEEQKNIAMPTDRASFIEHFPKVMEAWEEGAIYSASETYQDFATRVLGALEDAEKQDGTMLVTSGGVIGTAMRHILGLDLHSYAHMLLQVNNSSYHRYTVEYGARRLNMFNALAHLDVPERAYARTFI